MSYLLPDIISGITVSTVAVPQGLAYAVLAKLPPVYGLYTLIVPSLVYAVFGSAPLLHIGPFTLTSLMIGSSAVLYLTNHGLPPDHKHIPAVVMALSLTVGLVQLTLSISQFGTFIKKFLLRKPFVSAFTTASAYIIATSQLGPYFHLAIPQFKVLAFFQSIRFIVVNYHSIHLNTLYVAITSSILIILLTISEDKIKQKLKAKIEEGTTLAGEMPRKPTPWLSFFHNTTYPVILVVIIIYITLSERLGFRENYGLKTVGKIPTGLPTPSLPPLTTSNFIELLPDSLPIALVSYIITVSLAETFAHSTSKIRANQELFATSMTCIIGSFFLSYAGAGSLSRTAVVYNSGAKSQVASIVSAVVVVFILLWVAPVLQELPVSVLASIIIVSLGGHMKRVFTDPTNLWKNKKPADCGLWIVSFVAVIIWDAAIGCIIGLAASLFVGLWERSQPHLSSPQKLEVPVLEGSNPGLSYSVLSIRYNSLWSKHRTIFFFAQIANSLLEKGIPAFESKGEDLTADYSSSSSFLFIDISIISSLTAYDHVLLGNISRDFQGKYPFLQILFIHPSSDTPECPFLTNQSCIPTEDLLAISPGLSENGGRVACRQSSSNSLETNSGDALILPSVHQALLYIQKVDDIH